MSWPLGEHRDEIAHRILAAPDLLVCSDFDGTLTKIVDDPALANLSPDVREILTTLASIGGVRVGIISGRSLSDVKDRVGIPGLIYAGNHGFEISGPEFTFVEPGAVALRVPLRSLAREIESKLDGLRGAWVENKGLTLTVHFRRVAENLREDVRRIVLQALGGYIHLFRCAPGLMSFEVRPQVPWNKGTALKWIKEQLLKPDALVIYLGDDVTDEDAFAAFPEGITIRIGTAPATAARYSFDGVAQVPLFLDWLVRQKRESETSRRCSSSWPPKSRAASDSAFSP